MHQNIKDKIVQNQIIKKEDIENAPEWALTLANLLLEMSEIDEFCSDTTKFDQNKFLEEIYKIQDLIDLKNCDKVSSNYDKKMESFPIGVPSKLIPCLRKVIEQINEDL